MLQGHLIPHTCIIGEWTMATESQIQKVLTNLADVNACDRCGTRFRFGDLECPHCGADLEEYLRHWAEELIIELELGAGH